MGRPIPNRAGLALRLLLAWLLALQPLTAAYAAVATAHAAELCRGGPASDEDAPARADHAQECCLACVPTPAPPPSAEAEISVPAGLAAAPLPQPETVTVAKAGLGPQSARAPPL